MKNREIGRARNCYERAVDKLAVDDEEAEQLFVAFAEFEDKCRETDRARCIALDHIPKGRAEDLYSKFVAFEKHKFAELERSLYETERARAVFELAIDQPALDIPELLWKAYIDFEISEGEFERTRALYKRLLNHTKHLKVWISYSVIDDSDIKQKKKCLQHARDVFERAVSYLINSAPELKEERVMLLEEWIYMESNFGDANLVRAKLPKKLKKRRQIETEDGPAAYEEYIHYLFPEQTTSMKLLDSAYKWKKQRVASKN
uniref:Crooked neck protein n=1 Tax=Solanum tuberosum TaxID=4113 RepID=M1A878_SOLTU